MSSIKDYQVLNCTSQEALEAGVRELLGTGWEPIGGIQVLNIGSLPWWLQAMVKRG